nr:hypothetical protein [Tanacetum cinerariifolium]
GPCSASYLPKPAPATQALASWGLGLVAAAAYWLRHRRHFPTRAMARCTALWPSLGGGGRLFLAVPASISQPR